MRRGTSHRSRAPRTPPRVISVLNVTNACFPSPRGSTVKVVEKAPLVSTTTANVKEVYDIDFVRDTMDVDVRYRVRSHVSAVRS